MKSIFIVFVITVLFLVGMTKFTNDTNYNEAIRYAELSQYYDQKANGNSVPGNVFLETIELEVSFEGEVKSKKTIKVSYGTYLYQAIEEIGGLSKDADMRCINEYYVILTNQIFYIPGGKDLDKVSINNASEDELMTLPSVGGITASRIIEYRENNGEFETLEAIMNVNGIGSKTFNSIKDSIML